MKSKITLIYISLVTIFTGCNSDIFIDDFITDIPDTCVVENGKPYKLHFDSGDWSILNIYGTGINPLDYSVRNLDGEQKYLPLQNGETAIISYKTTFYEFRIEKRKSDEMEIICDKNLVNSTIGFKIEIGNEYTRKTINISLGQTSKFVIDKVEYDFKNDFYYNNMLVEQVNGMTIHNSNSEEPVTLSFHPFKNSLRRIEFFPDDYDTFYHLDKYLGNGLAEIPIPDIVDGKPVMRNTKVTFGVKEQSFRTGKLDNDFTIHATVQPGETQKIEIFNCIEEFTVKYKIHASNHETGEECIFTGQLNSKDPFDYLMIPQI